MCKIFFRTIQLKYIYMPHVYVFYWQITKVRHNAKPHATSPLFAMLHRCPIEIRNRANRSAASRKKALDRFSASVRFASAPAPPSPDNAISRQRQVISGSCIADLKKPRNRTLQARFLAKNRYTAPAHPMPKHRRARLVEGRKRIV